MQDIIIKNPTADIQQTNILGIMFSATNDTITAVYNNEKVTYKKDDIDLPYYINYNLEKKSFETDRASPYFCDTQ